MRLLEYLNLKTEQNIDTTRFTFKTAKNVKIPLTDMVDFLKQFAPEISLVFQFNKINEMMKIIYLMQSFF
jgi:hypothetical protein